MRADDVIANKAHAKLAAPVFVAIGRGDLQEALTDVKRLIKSHPNATEFFYVLSVVMKEAGQTDKALEFAERAYTSMPEDLHMAVHFSDCLMRQGRFEEALRLAQSCWAKSPTHPITCDLIGSVLTGCGELALALDAFQAAVRRAPDELHFQFNLATGLRAVGKLDEAEALYDGVIATSPHDWEAWRNRSDLRKQSPDRNHVSELEAMIPEARNDARGSFRLLGALAKELSDLEDYERSFAYLKRSADIRRKMMSYDVSGDVETMDLLTKTYTSDVSNSGGGIEASEPIFIVGLPRTGSTLLERMLGSHSDVFAAGELQNFAIEFVKLAKETFQGEALDKRSLVVKSTRLDFAELGRRYLGSTRPRTGHTPVFIDKLPLNFLYIGLIARAMPNAKIIHLARDPMDACYAIYKTAFDQAYPYSYDLDDLGRYYVAYHKLMQHWRAALPGKILDVAYEDLVRDPEAQVRRALSHCELDYQEACLKYHESDMPTNTASAAQVRQPVYQSSVAKWRKVEAGLAPLKAHLEASGIQT